MGVSLVGLSGRGRFFTVFVVFSGGVGLFCFGFFLVFFEGGWGCEVFVVSDS